MSVEFCKKKAQYVHLKVNYPYGKKWIFTAIYVIHNEEIRRVLWEDLVELGDSTKEP